jgi:hypothetical protein
MEFDATRPACRVSTSDSMQDHERCRRHRPQSSPCVGVGAANRPAPRPARPRPAGRAARVAGRPGSRATRAPGHRRSGRTPQIPRDEGARTPPERSDTQIPHHPGPRDLAHAFAILGDSRRVRPVSGRPPRTGRVDRERGPARGSLFGPGSGLRRGGRGVCRRASAAVRAGASRTENGSAGLRGMSRPCDRHRAATCVAATATGPPPTWLRPPRGRHRRGCDRHGAATCVRCDRHGAATCVAATATGAAPGAAPATATRTPRPSAAHGRTR